jgi:hypothetical protein
MPIQNPLLEDEQLYFMHLPKCAGSSLIRLLDQHFSMPEICPRHDNLAKFIETYSPEERAAFRFIRGHFPYKIIESLPRHPRTLTMLRHPVKRVVSAIAQHRRMEQQGVSAFQESILDLTIEQFMQHPDFGKRVSNVPIKYLLDPTPIKSPPERLQLAKERLAGFDFIGVVEQFDDSLALMAHTYGWYPIQDVKEVNVDPARLSKSELPQNVLDLICELNRDELELYEFGVKLFQERLAQMKTEPPYNLSQRVAPAQRLHFDFHRVNPGHGWHVGEFNPAHGYSRWNAEPTAYLQFCLEPNLDYVLRMRILLALEPDILRSLKLEINGTPIRLKSKKDGAEATILEGVIPATAIPAGTASSLALKTNRVIPINSVNFKTRLRAMLGQPAAVHEDERIAGLHFNWIDIYPLGSEAPTQITTKISGAKA